MMERDFMGLNSKDSSVIVVKEEEAAEASQDSGSGVQWPLSIKISALPHFMSFKVGQDDKKSKVVPNASRFMVMSSTDAFGLSSIRQAGEMQNVHSVHLHKDMKMLQSTNPFFKTQYTTSSQNFTGAPVKHLSIGGVSVTAPHSPLPSIGSFAGTAEAWFSAKPSQVPTQLTIFYGGTVNVYEDISPAKAQAIMLLAGNGTLAAPITTQPRAQVQVPTSRMGPGDSIYVNQPMNAQLCSALSSSTSVSSHSFGGRPIKNDEPAKLTGILTNPIGKVETSKVAALLGGMATSSMITSAVPQARKSSLARFFEKRKERVMSANPYSLAKDSGACAGNRGSNGISFSGSSGVSSGNEHGVATKG